MLQPLNTIKTLDDPLKQYMVEFDIKESPIVALVDKVGKLINAAGALGKTTKTAKIKDLKLRASSFSYPGAKIKQTELNINGFKRKIGTIQDKSGVWKCTVTENCGAKNGSILQLIENWCNCIHSTELGLRFPAISYVTTCTVTIYKTDGSPFRKVFLRGFYPIEYSVGNIDPNS